MKNHDPRKIGYYDPLMSRMKETEGCSKNFKMGVHFSHLVDIFSLTIKSLSPSKM